MENVFSSVILLSSRFLEAGHWDAVRYHVDTMLEVCSCSDATDTRWSLGCCKVHSQLSWSWVKVVFGKVALCS